MVASVGLPLLQSTSLLRGKTKKGSGKTTFLASFNPLPSCEGRLHMTDVSPVYGTASIHFPLARDDRSAPSLAHLRDRFNPLPSCEGRPVSERNGFCVGDASIHFPLAREDGNPGTDYDGGRIASIHFPLAREDLDVRTISTVQERFNPLPSCEGRLEWAKLYGKRNSFNPLPSCEGRLYSEDIRLRGRCFNPLPSCEGRLLHPRQVPAVRDSFNPLPSCEGRLSISACIACDTNASIHFPLAREDTSVAVFSP